MAGLLDFLGIKPGPAPTAFSTTGNNYAPWPPPPPIATPFAPAGGLAMGAPPAAPALPTMPTVPAYAPNPLLVAGGLPSAPPPMSDPAALISQQAAPSPPRPNVVQALGAGVRYNPAVAVPPSPGSMAGGLASGALPVAPAAARGMATPAGSTAPAAPAAPGRTGPIEIVRGGVSDHGGGGLNLNQMRVLLAGNRPRITPSEGAMYEIAGVHESNREKALAQNEANYQNLVRAANGNPELLAKAEAERTSGAGTIIRNWMDALRPLMGIGYSQAGLFPSPAAAGFTDTGG